MHANPCDYPCQQVVSSSPLALDLPFEFNLQHLIPLNIYKLAKLISCIIRCVSQMWSFNPQKNLTKSPSTARLAILTHESFSRSHLPLPYSMEWFKGDMLHQTSFRFTSNRSYSALGPFSQKRTHFKVSLLFFGPDHSVTVSVHLWQLQSCLLHSVFLWWQHTPGRCKWSRGTVLWWGKSSLCWEPEPSVQRMEKEAL